MAKVETAGVSDLRLDEEWPAVAGPNTDIWGCDSRRTYSWTSGDGATGEIAFRFKGMRDDRRG